MAAGGGLLLRLHDTRSAALAPKWLLQGVPSRIPGRPSLLADTILCVGDVAGPVLAGQVVCATDMKGRKNRHGGEERGRGGVVEEAAVEEGGKGT